MTHSFQTVVDLVFKILQLFSRSDDGLLYAELKLHLLNIVVVCFTCQIGDSYGDSQACQKQFSYDFCVMILPSVPLPWAALTVYPCLPEWKSNISSKVHCERFKKDFPYNEGNV